MVRAPYLDRSTGMKKGAWNGEEDVKLRSYIQRFGHPCWRLVPICAGLARTGKSCRLRWLNYLKPGVKHGNFTKHEEDLIIKLHFQLGNKWSQIAAKLPGRTDNEIKNHWHSHLKKLHINNQDAAAGAEVVAVEKSSELVFEFSNTTIAPHPPHHHRRQEELVVNHNGYSHVENLESKDAINLDDLAQAAQVLDRHLSPYEFYGVYGYGQFDGEFPPGYNSYCAGITSTADLELSCSDVSKEQSSLSETLSFCNITTNGNYHLEDQLENASQNIFSMLPQADLEGIWGHELCDQNYASCNQVNMDLPTPAGSGEQLGDIELWQELMAVLNKEPNSSEQFSSYSGTSWSPAESKGEDFSSEPYEEDGSYVTLW